MKTLRILSVLICFVISSQAQTLSDVQQKAINNYITMANQLSADVGAIGTSLLQSYRQMQEWRGKSGRPIVPYTCVCRDKSYYVTEAEKTAPALGSGGTMIISKAKAVHSAYQKIDETCKGIEIYYRLKDYESDGFKKLDEMIKTMQTQVATYHNLINDFRKESEKLVSALQPFNASSSYHKAERLMRDQLRYELNLLEAMTFNVNEGTHTGWPVEVAEKHILENVKRLETLNQSIAGLQYPASSMYKSFVESIASLQQSKRHGVDDYTYENQQSDRHSNEVYKNLINYFNNAGVSFYNNFINMSVQNGYRGIHFVNFCPVFTVKTETKKIDISVAPFADKPAVDITVKPVATSISSAVFSSLSNYVEFINEGMRQINNLMNPIHNLNSSASTGRSRLRNTGRMNLEYYNKSFALPVTLYQQTISQTKTLPAAYQKPLTEQAEVLYAILTELNQWNNALLAHSETKQLTKDSMEYVYGVVQRFKTLSEVFDEKKEKLYTDVRSIFESYKQADAKNSWQLSGNALRALLDENYAVLKKSKQFLQGDSTVSLNTTTIEQGARNLIVNEFTNLAGIQKLGRNNGNCPYTPYEGFAESTNHFAEAVQKAKPGKVTSSYHRHPYNDLIYRYNQILVRDYNKFAELAKVPLLQAVIQVELFEVVPPREVAVSKPVTQPIAQKEDVPKTGESLSGTKQNQKPSEAKQVSGSVIHDTVRITDVIRIETIRQDTVYVSRVDTVYVGLPGENLMSMEGYATNNMVLLLDVSGSMNNPDKLPLLKKSILLLMKMMRPEDQVSIITYSGKAKIELPPTSFKEEEKITRVIERLKSEGKTDGNAGIKLAYQTADKNYIRGGNNRIILATDGEFPIGSPTYDLVKKFAGEDIFITVFNFGKTTLSAKNLQQLAELGKGNYEYITRENVDMKLIREAKAKRKK
ncbi:MAG: VWA domain-containing protein [Cyclobacteriaceae bacterium]|nr:MAG: VWA domain-containing protein [Cyclobacteriaceae bacterium]